MKSSKFAGAALRAVVAFSIASLSVSAASAQDNQAMGGMKMAPGSKMEMKGKKMPAHKPAHHKAGKHHKSAKK